MDCGGQEWGQEASEEAVAITSETLWRQQILFSLGPSTGREPNPGQSPAKAPDGPSSKVMASGQTNQTGSLHESSAALWGRF